MHKGFFTTEAQSVLTKNKSGKKCLKSVLIFL
jgi:hypothetical protein